MEPTYNGELVLLTASGASTRVAFPRVDIETDRLRVAWCLIGAGVAPSAIYRHFTDKDQLRAAIAQAAREQLARSMSQPRARTLTKASAYARFRAIGEAYIDFALNEPRLYAAAFADCQPSREDSPSGWNILAEALDALVATGAMPKSRRAGAEIVAWSAVHGISDMVLLPYLQSRLKSNRKHLTTQVLDGVMRSLEITR